MRTTALRRTQRRISHARCITSVSGDCAILHDGFRTKRRNCRSAETPRLTGLVCLFACYEWCSAQYHYWSPFYTWCSRMHFPITCKRRFFYGEIRCLEYRCIGTNSMTGIAKLLLVHHRIE
ncbi:hypothetical protein COCCADRAFT_109774 [Bipolaris zeicola 26-R-13]|uniref:Uncharacterized protein n=1 Tax=Cochliobolus carbonum (strain 26-R-13) TaxID=930089 RepID=W6YAS1_COCC2|nr:uncharacterized protein COCCADRAFT_109774 [Bipolaris zeicola 26-R-13]EUC28206.1 hypothetical protein COCCADRAFT_109774 [Bipolaris zeicola 26-R-13]